MCFFFVVTTLLQTLCSSHSSVDLANVCAILRFFPTSSMIPTQLWASKSSLFATKNRSIDFCPQSQTCPELSFTHCRLTTLGRSLVAQPMHSTGTTIPCTSIDPLGLQALPAFQRADYLGCAVRSSYTRRKCAILPQYWFPPTPAHKTPLSSPFPFHSTPHFRSAPDTLSQPQRQNQLCAPNLHRNRQISFAFTPAQSHHVHSPPLILLSIQYRPI
jgi:hypothetical protein